MKNATLFVGNGIAISFFKKTFKHRFSILFTLCLALNLSAIHAQKKPPIGILPAPSHLTATAVNETTIRIDWRDNSTTESGFEIEYKQEGSSTFQLLRSVRSNTVTFTHSSLQSGVQYTYRVRAYQLQIVPDDPFLKEKGPGPIGNLYSSYSNEASATTPITIFPPARLSANALNESSIRLNWSDNSSNETGFQIQYKSEGQSSFTNLTNVSANTESYTHSSGQPATQYTYRVRAYRSGTYSSFSNEASAATTIIAPSHLSVAAVNENSLRLNWRDNSSVEQVYQIEYMMEGQSSFTYLSQVSANQETYVHSNIQPGTQYTYRVRADRSGNYSNYSNQASGETVLSVPTNLSTSVVNERSIQLNWSDNSAIETAYQIEYRMEGQSGFSYLDHVTANITTYRHNSIQPGVEYTYRVRADYMGTYSSYSNNSAESTIILAPTNLISTVIDERTIKLEWTDNSNIEMAYQIECKMEGQSSFTFLDHTSANETEFIHENLQPGDNYTYRVRADYMGTYSSYSNETVNATTFHSPTNLTSRVIDERTIRLNWEDNSSIEMAYLIEYKLEWQSSFSFLDHVSENQTSFTHSYLEPGMEYTYRVRADWSGVYSEYTNEVSESTEFYAPTNLTTSVVDERTIQLNWYKNSNIVMVYQIEYKREGESSFTYFDHVSSDETSFLHEFVEPGVVYTYRVRGDWSGVYSQYTNESAIATIFKAPSNLTSTIIDERTVKLHWYKNSNIVTDYEIEYKVEGQENFSSLGHAQSDVTSFTHTHLQPGTQYTYRVRGASTTYHSDYSNIVTETTAFLAPTNLTSSTFDERTIQLQWYKNSNIVMNYIIEYKTEGASGFTYLDDVSSDATSYTHSHVQPGTTYIYRVRGDWSGIYSDYSNETSETTTFLSPTNLTTSVVDERSIQLQWYRNSNIVMAFLIEYKIEGQESFVFLDHISPDETSFLHEYVEPGVEYTYRVRGDWSGIYSDYTNESSATTIFQSPTNLIATIIEEDAIQLNWESNSDIAMAYLIEYKLNDQENFSFLDHVSSDKNSFIHEFLETNNEFTYRVRADWSGNYSEYSNEAQILLNAINSPSNLCAILVGNNIDLVWNDNSSVEDNYEIEVKINDDPFILLDETSENSNSFTHLGINSENTYTYRVRAKTNSTFSLFSNEALASIASLAVSVIDEKSVMLNWFDNFGDKDSYEIEYKMAHDNAYTLLTQVEAYENSFIHMDITPGIQYLYRVRAKFDESNFSEYTNIATAATNFKSPTNLRLSIVDETTIQLDWYDNSDIEERYEIEYKSSNDHIFKHLTYIDHIEEVNNSYIHLYLSPNEQYTYRVRANAYINNEDVYSEYSNEETTSTTFIKPSELRANILDERTIQLDWNDNSAIVESYEIEYKTENDVSFRHLAFVSRMDENMDTYIHEDLSPGQQYIYRVRAYAYINNQEEYSEYSNEINAITIFANPTELRTTLIDETTIQLDWIENSSIVERYELEYKINDEVSYRHLTNINHMEEDMNSFIHNNLSPENVYTYRVRAYAYINNEEIYSEYSNETTASSTFIKPVDLRTTIIDEISIRLDWINNSSIVERYEIEYKTAENATFEHLTIVNIFEENNETFTHNDVDPGVDYIYRARAIAHINYEDIYSDYSNEANAATTFKEPTELRTTIIDEKTIRLDWIDNSNIDDRYEIEYKAGEDASFVHLVFVDNFEGNNDNYEHTNLSPGVEYTYRIRAQAYINNKDIYSDYSNQVTESTQFNAPDNLTVSIEGETTNVLSWNDNSNIEDFYYIEYRTNDGESFSQLTQTFGNDNSYNHTNLDLDKDYVYRVRAYVIINNKEIYSEYSNEAPSSNTYLQANAINETTNRLEWTDNLGIETNYEVEYKNEYQTSFISLGFVAANIGFFEHSNISPSIEYIYRIKGNVLQEYSNEATAIPIFNAPTNLSAIIIDETTIQLNWEDNSNIEQHYEIEYLTENETYYQPLNYVYENTTQIIHNSVEPGKEYKYRVRAHNNELGGEDVWSNYSNVYTISTTFHAPTNLTTTVVNETTIQLEWNDNSNIEQHYEIEYLIDNTTNYVQLDYTSENSTQYIHTNVEPGKEYKYRVRAHNNEAGGDDIWSSYTNEASAIATFVAPTNLTVTAIDETTIQLEWDDNSEIEQHYEIEYLTNNATNYVQLNYTSENSTQYIHTNVEPGKEYMYRVRAHNNEAGGDDIWSSYTNEASAITTFNAPTNLTVTAIDETTIQLEWNDNSEIEQHYEIEYLTDNATNYVQLDYTSENSIQYIHTNVEPWKEYKYRVRAHNNEAGGDDIWSVYSNESFATTTFNAPTNLIASTIDETTIQLEWDDNSDIEQHYEIEFTTDERNEFVQLDYVHENTSMFLHTNMEPGVEYFYRVRAHNNEAGGDDIWTTYSNITSASTTFNVPSNLSAFAVNETTIQLEWDDNSNIEEHYEIEYTYEELTGFIPLGFVEEDVSYFVHEGITADKEYTYRIRAHNHALTGEDIWSEYSSEYTASTIDIAPTVICQDFNLYLDINGIASLTSADIDNGSHDASGIALMNISKESFNCSDIGINEVILTVTDIHGNASNCSSNVTVIDNVSPIVLTQNINVELNDSGNASITADDIDNGSSDNCGIASMSISQTEFNCEHIGENEITLTVVDNSGNETTTTAIVTVTDEIAPTVIAQNITVSLDNSGNATITADDIDNGSSDNCGIASMSISQSDFTCKHIGKNEIALTVIDNSSNEAYATAIVTITDEIVPTPIAQNITVSLDESGNASITADDIDNGSSDNCGIVSKNISQSNFTCEHIGENEVTLTVTDNAGNEATATALVTVIEDVAPTVFAQNITVSLDESGNASIIVDDIDNGSSDNCSIASMSISQSNFTCEHIGENEITLTVADNSGNEANATAIITVVDEVVPTAIAQNIIVSLDDSGNAAITADDIDNGSSDNCGIASMSISQSDFTCEHIGENEITLIVIDNSGNEATATATITVVDEIAPTTIAQNIIVSLDDSGNAAITADDIDNGSSDNCGIASMSISQSDFTCEHIGENEITLTVTDNAGNVSNASATITVVDEVTPTAIAQNITVSLNDFGNATSTADDIDNGSSDNCGIASMSISQSDFTCEHIGENEITLTVIDNSSNEAYATAIVTITDEIVPTPIAQNITVSLDEYGNASITADDIDNGSSDNCGIASKNISQSNFTCEHIGENEITLTVTDNAGNVANATATITVVDEIAPTAIAQNIAVALDNSGNATITADDIDSGSSDNCSIASMSISQTEFNCEHIGENEIALTVTDNSGNEATATATITVVDEIAPTTIAQNITVSLNDFGNATITADDIDNGSSDNCGIASMSISRSDFTCEHIGENEITLTVIDNSGNEAYATAIVIVTDEIAPIAIAQNIAVALDESGNASITADDIDNGSSDNCGIASMSISQSNFICEHIGENEITLTVIDNSGNEATATATITVVDEIAPTTIAQKFTVSLNDFGNATITADDIDSGSSDNCGIASMSISQSNFTCEHIGENEVTLTVTDNAGNEAYATAIVIVTDEIAPIVIAQNITVSLDESGNASITADDIDNGSSDNCGIASMSISQSDFTCEHIGENEITLTVIDNSGNEAYTTAIIIVTDEIAPVLTIIEDIYVESETGLCGATVEFEVEAYDNCDNNLTISSSHPSGSFFPIGITIIDYSATDYYGNISTNSFTVEVIDNEDLSINSHIDTIEVWPPNHDYFTITASTFIESITDNCNEYSLEDIYIYSVTSDELENANGDDDGNTINDIVISGDCKSVDVRSERSENGDGRIYNIKFYIINNEGDSIYTTYYAIVPVENESVVINSGIMYEAYSICSGNIINSINDNFNQAINIYDNHLGINSPNPFSDLTNIEFYVPKDSYVTLTVLNLYGKTVDIIYSGNAARGIHQLTWDGIDINGNKLSNGTYLYTLQTKDCIKTRRMMIIR